MSLDLLTRHRLGMLHVDAEGLRGRSPAERMVAVYQGFLDRVPYENLSNARACRARPDEPTAWPRTTQHVLRENRDLGLGGTSFSLAYALRDLLRGVGANAHCALGRNLVTEEAHAAVIAYRDGADPLLFDPTLLVCGPIDVRPGGTLEDPLGTIRLQHAEGPALRVTLRMAGSTSFRSVYSMIPAPAPPVAYRQAWVASFHRGRRSPLRLARRSGEEIRRYGETRGTIEILRPCGLERCAVGEDRPRVLHEQFGIDESCLREWFHPGGAAEESAGA